MLKEKKGKVEVSGIGGLSNTVQFKNMNQVSMADQSNRDLEQDGGVMRDFKHSLPMALLKAREAAMNRFRPHLREHGLTEQQWRAIRALSEYGELEVSQLAERSLLLAPSLTRILQFLVHNKIARRKSDPKDQRRSKISLTVKGKKLFASVAKESEQLYARITEEFGDTNMQALYALLYEFWDVMDKNQSS